MESPTFVSSDQVPLRHMNMVELKERSMFLKYLIQTDLLMPDIMDRAVYLMNNFLMNIDMFIFSPLSIWFGGDQFLDMVTTGYYMLNHSFWVRIFAI